MLFLCFVNLLAFFALFNVFNACLMFLFNSLLCLFVDVWDMFEICLDHGRDIVGTFYGTAQLQERSPLWGPGDAAPKDAGLFREAQGFLGSA